MKPGFNRLKIFYHIFKTTSVSGAAEELHITPSAVSQQLKKLEEEIGSQLFSRPHKRLVPTAAGKELYDTVRPFIVAMESTVSRLQKAKETPTGLLKIGLPIEFGKIVVPQIIAKYRTKYPEVTFLLKLGRTSDLLPLVLNGELDFACIDTFPTRDQMMGEWQNFALSPLFEENMVLACSKEYHHNLKEDYSYENLTRQHFIAQQSDARAIRNWFYHHYNKTCQDLNVVLTIANHQAVVNSIKAGVGLGIIVSQLVVDEIENGDLVCIKTKKDAPVNRVSLVQLLDKIPSLTEKSFQAHVMRELNQ